MEQVARDLALDVEQGFEDIRGALSWGRRRFKGFNVRQQRISSCRSFSAVANGGPEAFHKPHDPVAV